MKITRQIEVTITFPEEISEKDAEERLYTALYKGLCEFTTENIEFVYCDFR